MLRPRRVRFPGNADMLELTDNHPDTAVQESEYTRLLGYPKRHVLKERSRELADQANQWYAANGRPWIYARQVNAVELTGGTVRLDGTDFTSKRLHDQFARAQSDGAVLAAVSAGPECEEHARQLWQEGKPDEYFFLEIFGSTVVEHLITVASGHICGWADQQGLAVLPHYSPGYSGWDISDQVKLWQLLRESGTRHVNGRLDVLETGMLRPKKSQLAVFGITRHLEKVRDLARLIPCENCSLPKCRYRRAPYRHAPPQLEEVRALLARALDDFGGRSDISSESR